MKKSVLPAFLAVGCMLFALGGCYEPLPITDRELDMVAEYAAGVLVKHGTATKEALLNEKEQQELLDAQKPSATAKPTEAPERPGDGEDSPSVTKTPDTVTTPAASDGTASDLTRLFAKDGFSFEYTGFEETLLYQGTGEIFASADKGKKLIVVEFLVKNTSGEARTLSMNKGAAKECSFSLRVDSRSFKPTLTLLKEDIYNSYEVSYEAGEVQKGVLIFECPDETNTATMNLSILKENGGKDDSVIIKMN